MHVILEICGTFFSETGSIMNTALIAPVESVREREMQMLRTLKPTHLIFVALLTPLLATGFTQVAARTISLDAPGEMQTFNVKAERVTYKMRSALRVTDIAPANVQDGERLVVLNKTMFQDGIIQIDLAGEPGSNAGEGARGFVGVAFRVSPGAKKD